jgi:hypothetical protein
MMQAHGYVPDALAGLVRSVLAAAHVDRVRAGSEWLEVRRFSITQAGQQLLGQR